MDNLLSLWIGYHWDESLAISVLVLPEFYLHESVIIQAKGGQAPLITVQPRAHNNGAVVPQKKIKLFLLQKG